MGRTILVLGTVILRNFFFRIVRESIESGSDSFFLVATHNPESVVRAVEAMEIKNKEGNKGNSERIAFAQLSGMGDQVCHETSCVFSH